MSSALAATTAAVRIRDRMLPPLPAGGLPATHITMRLEYKRCVRPHARASPIRIDGRMAGGVYENEGAGGAARTHGPQTSAGADPAALPHAPPARKVLHN